MATALINVLDVTVDSQNRRGWPKTDRQLQWAYLHIMDGLTAHDAALRVGYSRSTANALDGEGEEPSTAPAHAALSRAPSSSQERGCAFKFSGDH